MISVVLFANIQKIVVHSPARKTDGTSRLKRPAVSDNIGGTSRPNIPPPLRTARTAKDNEGDNECEVEYDTI